LTLDTHIRITVDIKQRQETPPILFVEKTMVSQVVVSVVNFNGVADAPEQLLSILLQARAMVTTALEHPLAGESHDG
jgi:hypothetical protein